MESRKNNGVSGVIAISPLGLALLEHYRRRCGYSTFVRFLLLYRFSRNACLCRGFRFDLCVRICVDLRLAGGSFVNWTAAGLRRLLHNTAE